MKKIEKYGLRDFILSLYQEGRKPSEILDIVRRVKKVQLTEQTIRNFLKTIENIKDIKIEKQVDTIIDKMIKEEIEERINVYKEMVDSLQMVNEVITEIKIGDKNESDYFKLNILLDKMLKTKTEICKVLQNYHKNDYLDVIFLSIVEELKKSALKDNKDIFNILKKVYYKFIE